VLWALTQNALGLAWSKLSTGGPPVRISGRPSEHCESALEVLSRETRPGDWAATQHNLGLMWSNLPTGNRSGNLQEAIDYYREALTVRTSASHPVDWAWTQHNLGLCLEQPIGGRPGWQPSQSHRLLRKQRSQCARATLTQWTGLGHSTISLSLGVTCRTGDQIDNLQRAISYCEAALTVRARDTHPADWALTQNVLGHTWSNMPAGDTDENLRRAIGYHEAALNVYTREAHRVEWRRPSMRSLRVEQVAFSGNAARTRKKAGGKRSSQGRGGAVSTPSLRACLARAAP